MKTLYMETTKKSPEETSSEIQEKLKSYGLTKFMFDYSNGDITGCIFFLKIKKKDVPIKLPIRWLPLWKMSQNGETKYIRTEKQAKRVAWRQVLKWIESQLSMIDIDMVEIGEVFLPYMLISKNKTLYQHLVDNDMKLIENKGE